MQPSTKKNLTRAAIGVVAAIAVLSATVLAMRMDAVSRAQTARKLTSDYSERSHTTQVAAIKAAAQFQECQRQALQSKDNGEPDPAAKFFDCFAPGVAKGDGSLTGPYLLFGAALMDPPAEDKAAERDKTLKAAYAQANKMFEKETREAIDYDKRMDDACNGWWSRRVCSLATPKAGALDDGGVWRPIQKAPQLAHQMQEIDVALWQANHSGQVHDQLVAQSQAAATGDKKTIHDVAERAPWVPAAQESQKLRESQLAQWAKEAK